MINKIILTLLGVILIIATYIRYENLDSHFSHTDDSIIPLLYQQLHIDKSDYIVDKLGKANLNDNVKEVIDISYPIMKPFVYAAVVSKSTTYAPLQYIFTGLLLDSDYEYKETLYWSRLPSFVFSIISFFVLIYLFMLFDNNKYKMHSVFGIAILGFSWEFIIYSMQSESYAIGVLSALVTFLFFVRIIKDMEVITNKNAFFYGIGLSMLMFSQYQILFLLPGFFISIFILYRQKHLKFAPQFYIILAITLISTIMLFILFLKERLSRGLNWNAGPNNEFLFSLKNDNLYESIVYTIDFFFTNSYIMLKSIISIGNETSIVNNIMTGVFILLSFMGLFSFFKSRNLEKKYFSYFTIIVIITWITLTILQKITLSPTRHSLILLSFIVVYVPIGLDYSLRFYSDGFRKNVFIMFSCLLIVFFLVDYNKNIRDRMDIFNPLEVEKLIKNYHIGYIYSYNYTSNLIFINYIEDNFKNEYLMLGDIYFVKNNNKNNNKNIMLISQSSEKPNKRMADYLIGKENFNIDEYVLIYSKKVRSKTGICFSSLTKNGTNSIFIYILKPKKGFE